MISIIFAERSTKKRGQRSKYQKCLSPFILFCFVLLAQTTTAQRFGGHRPSLRWQQVNTASTRVIFPEGYDTFAMRIASIAQRLNDATAPTIGDGRHKISIVLQPQTTVSNGYVSMGPFRSEFYLTAPQNSFELGSLPWHDMLATHEYRHVQQYNNFNVGLSKVFRVLFGQQGQELANSVAVPNWFWEGDAVYQETLVSQQGRGRLPFFYDDYRSLWKAGINYSWMKLRNGSLRDFTPDHYRLGYMLIAYGREKYGDDFWKKVTRDAAAFKGLFYPLQKAIARHSGKSYETFRNEALNYFKEQTGTSKAVSTVRQHFLGNQQFPVYAGNDTILYVRDSYKQVPYFIEKTGNTERKIRVRDVSLDNQFSYSNGKIVYASYRPDYRWSWNDYNEIQVLDVATSRQTTITRHSKYFSPDISKDGKTIVAVDVQPGSISQLHLLNAEDGTVLSKIPNKEHYFFTFPKFVSEHQVLSAAKNALGQMALVLVNSTDGSSTALTPFSFRVMGFPLLQNDTVYFSAADKLNDMLFAVSLHDKKMYRLDVPTEGIGAYQPAVHNNNIQFSTFTAYGYRLQQTSKQKAVWQEVTAADWQRPLASFGVDLSKNNAAGLLPGITAQPITVSKYPKSFRIVNFHSLRPYVDDPEYTISVVGENVLNTLQTELYFTYNNNEQFKQIGFNTEYAGWFPHISAGVYHIFDRQGLFKRTNPFRYDQTEIRGGLNVPFNFSKGRMYTNLTIGADYVYSQPTVKGFYKDSVSAKSYGYISSYINFSNQSQQARQHIYPRLAQTLFVNYRTAATTYTGSKLLVNGYLYFPGLFNTHNLVFNIAYAGRNKNDQIDLPVSFPFSRGYNSVSFYHTYKLGINYHFPLVYPDFGIGDIVYFQRVRANAFYDYTRGEDFYTNGQPFLGEYRSVGGEILFDTQWWNQLSVSFGFRYARLLDNDFYGARDPNWFEFILPVNLLQR
jgi:hypothetical protein